MKPAHLAVLVVMNLFWAGTYSAFKLLGDALTAGEIVTLRYTLAALALGVLWPMLPGRIPQGADLLKTALMGVAVFAIGPRLQVLGVTLGKAGDSSVLIALEPLVTAVAAACFLREHVPLRRWAGFMMGMAGVLLLNGVWRLDLHWAGLVANLIFVSSFTCEAAFSVIGKPILERAGLLKVVAVVLAWGTLANLVVDGPGTWAKLSALTPVSWLVVAYLVVICTVVGYSVWYVVIRDTDVSLAAMTILIQPVFGVLIAALALAEPLHWGQLWGAAAIAAGLALGLTHAPEITSPGPNTPLEPE
jgi:drug/metabolite transporter (DMT)-like permease